MRRLFIGAPLLACLFCSSASAGVMCLSFELIADPLACESTECEPCGEPLPGSSYGGSVAPLFPLAIFASSFDSGVSGYDLTYPPFVPSEPPLVPPVDGGSRPVVAPEPSSLAVMGCVAVCVVVGCVRRRGSTGKAVA